MQGQTSNKAKQHSTPKAVVTFPKKNELPQVAYMVIYSNIHVVLEVAKQRELYDCARFRY